MSQKRVGIIRGGAGKHYVSSLRKGGEIISLIFENLGDKYKVVDILIDKEGTWHLNGKPIKPADLAHQVDVVWNTAHPSFSVTLDNLSIPNVGCGSFSAALEDSREMLREHMKQIDLPMPRSIILPVYQKDFDGEVNKYIIRKAKEVHEKFPAPWIVNPVVNVGDAPLVSGEATSPTSTIRVKSLARTFNELVALIEECVNNGQSILVEEFIAGKVVSVHSVPKFRGKDIYTFPLGNSFGIPPRLDGLVEAGFSAEEKEKLEALAKKLHTHLGAKHYLRSDFILNSRGKVYLLQIESAPDLKPGSHFLQACESVGAKPQHVIEHILEQVLS